MKIRYQYLIVLVLIIMTCSSTYSQGYLSKFVPLDFPVNTTNLQYENDKYIVFSINILDGREATTIIELDRDFDTIRTINYFDVFFGRFGPKKYEDRYYAYGADQTDRERHLMIEMYEDFVEIKRDSFYPDGNSYNANCMTMIEDKIVGGAWDYYSCSENFECTYMNYKVISIEGEELKSFNVDEEGEPYFFSFEVDHTIEGDIICGGNRYADGARATVYKSDQDGTMLWKHKSAQKQSRGNVPVWVEELSDGTIVYTDKLEKGDDDDYLDLGFTDRPNQIVWLSADGDSLFSYLDTVNWTSFTEYSGIKKGKGDYFFAFGQYNLNHLEPMEFDGVYGFLMKISNGGEVVWRKLYKHDPYEFSSPTISHIYEHENGDISTLGREVTEDGLFMWMMRVNEHGCIEGNECDEPLLLSSEDHLDNRLAQKISVYPNPTNSDVRISISDELKIEHLSLFDLHGQLLYETDAFRTNESIDLDSHNRGIYILKIKLKDDGVVVRKIAKN